MTNSVGAGLSRKARLRQLDEQLLAVEAQLKAQKPVPVLTIARCGHSECGTAAPAELPTDCLVIDLGCKYAIPQVEAPAELANTTPNLDRIPEVLDEQRGAAGSPLERARKRMIQLHLK
nr:hypothetical protein 10 [bacterium]